MIKDFLHIIGEVLSDERAREKRLRKSKNILLIQNFLSFRLLQKHLSDNDTKSLDNVELNSNDETKEDFHLKHPKYNLTKMSASFKWKKGLEFTFIKQFKSAMKEWCVFNGRDVVMKPNDLLKCKFK